MLYGAQYILLLFANAPLRYLKGPLSVSPLSISVALPVLGSYSSMLLVDFALGAKYTLPLGAATAPLYAPLVLYIVLPKSNELLLLVPVKSKELMAADI
jgi:hypothetical protein